MSLEKAQLKVSTANEIGNKLDDALEVAQFSIHAAKGARDALNIACRKLEEHQKNIDKDLDEGKIGLELHTSLKRVVTQCGGIVKSLSIAADDEFLRAQGRVEGYRAAVAVCKSIRDAEEAKARAIIEAMKKGDLVAEASGKLPGPVPGDAPVIPIRPEGTHPGPSLADRRKAEEAAEKAAEHPPAPPVEQPSIQDPPLEPPVIEDVLDAKPKSKAKAKKRK